MASTHLKPEKTTEAADSSARSLPRWLLYIGGGVVLLALLAFLLLRMRPPELHGMVLQSPQRATDFTLVSSSTGEPVSLSDLRGKYVMLYFGYTFCPDVCPTTLADLRMMAQDLSDKEMEDVQVVMVTVDPERDTPERLGEYLGFFDPRFLGMTGPLDEIIAASTQFGVYFEYNKVEGASEYLVDHTSTITLIDPDGYARMIFPYGTPGADLAEDLRYWMKR
ncbi:MAG: SCO family protein [Caldilineaceae bacterium]|nr:SCO family protein [Caldilineaceae bacterium]